MLYTNIYNAHRVLGDGCYSYIFSFVEAFTDLATGNRSSIITYVTQSISQMMMPASSRSLSPLHYQMPHTTPVAALPAVR